MKKKKKTKQTNKQTTPSSAPHNRAIVYHFLFGHRGNPLALFLEHTVTVEKGSECNKLHQFLSWLDSSSWTVWMVGLQVMLQFVSWECKGSIWQFLTFYMLLISIFHFSTDEHFKFTCSPKAQISFFLLKTHFYFTYSTIFRYRSKILVNFIGTLLKN